jgi:Bacterial Ig-like domain (group 3)
MTLSGDECSRARRGRFIIGAALWWTLVLLMGIATAGAGVVGARVSPRGDRQPASHAAACRCAAARGAARGARKPCSPKKPKRRRCSKPKGSPPPKQRLPAGSAPTPETPKVLEEQPPATGPGQSALPGSPVEANPPAESKFPVETEPPAEPPVEKKPQFEKVSTTTTLSSSANPSTLGHAVTYTARMLPTTATGMVAFKDAGTPITGCATQTVSSGTATCAVAGYAAVGSNTIIATYSGDGDDLTSTSAALTQTVKPPAPFRFFAPTSFWNEPVPADAPLDPNSTAIVSAFDGEIAAANDAKEGLPTINTTAWSVPIYTVSNTQATVKVTQEYGGNLNAALQSAWDAVPLPPEAKPAAGTDKDLVVWQPSTNKLWEFWGLEKTEAGWWARWGGAMGSASSDPGVYGPEAWPGAQPGWGVSATSLSVAGGLITFEDLELGQINHALAIAIPNTHYGEYASPAQRTDGYSTKPLSLPEGAHLRLDPNLDLASLHLPRLTLMMAEAAQRYGIFVRDSGANVAFVAQDPTPTGSNPYTAAHGYFEGKSPAQLLASFPWSDLELLKMELHKT